MTDNTSNAILIRALKTFLQGALGALVVSQSFTTAALIGAVAAGLSAVMNLFIKPVEAK